MTDAPRRDESTEALLRRTLSPGQEPETAEACLDGETAAAWLDGKLHGGALERARTHTADCARCQALMATFVRAEAGFVQPGAPARPAAVVEEAPRRQWWIWVVPVLVPAAAVVIAVTLPRSKPPATPTSAAAPAPDQSKLADAKNAAVQTPAFEEKKAEEPAKIDAQKDVDQAGRLDKKRQQDALNRAAAPAAATKSANEVAAAAPPPPTQPTPAAAPARDEARTRELVQAQPLKRDEIGSPDPLVRWRLRRRTVEKSIDGGKSWTAVPTGLDAEWTAGAAPTPTAFWIVGRGGMIARSTDGRAFERLPFPELTDLSAVQATDAQTATVSSADGHTFSTTDGGRSWARRDLQEKQAAPFRE
ncbi:MAG TPA: hypothetical protein VJN96_17025 [Vicinamibacterales bacterium]|nr:hypothetical protein [Vicinamibacterales bacterium]